MPTMKKEVKADLRKESGLGVYNEKGQSYVAALALKQGSNLVKT